MKTNLKRKLTIAAAVLLISMVSIETQFFTIGRVAKADIEWFADETGGEQNCILKVRNKEKSTLTTIPLSLTIESEYTLYPGKQGACEDASIFYACRTKCVPNTI